MLHLKSPWHKAYVHFKVIHRQRTKPFPIFKAINLLRDGHALPPPDARASHRKPRSKNNNETFLSDLIPLRFNQKCETFWTVPTAKAAFLHKFWHLTAARI
jgi:hypothetical protein